MYLFPTIKLPPKAIAAAKAEERSPDEFYCMKMLEMAGVATVPGSGFGQKEGELHFRTTFLAPGNEAADRLVKFHAEFMKGFA
jgi:alanine transaminase